MQSKRKILFAAAGTAGHVEPALAVARWIRKEDPGIELVFVGTSTGVENSLVLDAGFELKYITKAPFPRKPNMSAVAWPWRFLKSLIEVRRAISGTSLIMGFGGYVCAPTYLLGRSRKIPLLIHEANAKTGMANTLGKRLGAQILYAFAPTQGDAQAQSPVAKSINNLVVGVPLRSEIVHLARLSWQERESARSKALTDLGLDASKPTLLVFGGSLGSSRFNEAIAGAIDEILSRGVQVIHAVGKNNELPASRPGYLALPYIKEMAQVYAASDLIMCRSGAVSTTETAVLGIYSVYVPLDIGNGEQVFNAQVVVDAGGGEIVKNSELSGELIISHLNTWFERASEYRSQGRRVDLPLDAAIRIGIKALSMLRGQS